VDNNKVLFFLVTVGRRLPLSCLALPLFSFVCLVQFSFATAFLSTFSRPVSLCAYVWVSACFEINIQMISEPGDEGRGGGEKERGLLLVRESLSPQTNPNPKSNRNPKPKPYPNPNSNPSPNPNPNLDP
jgi:hypothetical protein